MTCFVRASLRCLHTWAAHTQLAAAREGQGPGWGCGDRSPESGSYLRITQSDWRLCFPCVVHVEM